MPTDNIIVLLWHVIWQKSNLIGSFSATDL